MDKKIKVVIDGHELEVERNTTVLDAANEVGIYIPTLCYLKSINEIGSCRVCVVEVEGMRTLQAACVFRITRPMTIYTNSERARRAKVRAVELILSNHNRECTYCIRNLNCELQNITDTLGVRDIRAKGENKNFEIHADNCFIVRDYSKCIVCRRCEAVCSKLQTANVYSAQRRGLNAVIAPFEMRDLGETNCISCGQCVISCPTGSLSEKEATQDVFRALKDPDKHVVVQTAPSIQVTLGELFDEPLGTQITGKMINALHKLGFNKVFPTDLSADLTIMEEASELIERLRENENLPLLSSCCPGWVKFAEHFYPEFLPHLSSCKSPHEMFGVIIKTYYAKKYNIEPQNIVTVAVMPCVAKKFEACREEMKVDGYRAIDHVITTRELARMIRQAGVLWENLTDDEYDKPFDISSGAGAIFGATGGVIEAAVRTAYYFVNNEETGLLDFKEVRGVSGLKEAEIELMGRKIKVAVAHSTGNARALLESIKAGKQYDYVEIMACPGGCVGGSGQPILSHRDHRHLSLDYRHNRADALYKLDEEKDLRRSHQNPDVQEIYNEFLGTPLSPVAKKILHTTYIARGDVEKS